MEQALLKIRNGDEKNVWKKKRKKEREEKQETKIKNGRKEEKCINNQNANGKKWKRENWTQTIDREKTKWNNSTC